MGELVGAPSAHEREKAYVNLLHINHTAARHSGRGGDFQVLDLKHHVKGVRELDTLRVGETEGLVIVKDGIHVLDPNGIDRSVEDDPLAVVRTINEGLAN